MNVIQMMNPIRKLKLALFVCSLAITANNTAYAKDYKVEVLLFENTVSSTATESHNYVEPKEMQSGSQTWALEPTMLLEEAEKLSQAEDYQLLHHFSWGQESLPFEESANYNVIETRTQGWIKIYAEQLLFANLDLDFNGYRLLEKRRLKLNEKHYFDHPKFGVLLQVSRLEIKEEDEDESISSQLGSNEPS